MKSHTSMKSQAFWSGFWDSFGNVGRVYEPVINGLEVEKEIIRPASASLLRLKYKQNGSYRQLMRTRFRARQTAEVKSGRRIAA